MFNSVIIVITIVIVVIISIIIINIIIIIIDNLIAILIMPSMIPGRPLLGRVNRKGTNGVYTNGVTANFTFFTGTFGVLQLTYFDIPKSDRAYLFPQSVNICYFL